MNNIDPDSFNESAKVIKIIEGEFSELSSASLVKELKSIPQFDMKKLRLFALKAFQSFEKAKDSSIEKIAKYFNDKKSKSDLKVKWISLGQNSLTNNNASSFGPRNFFLRISSSGKHKSTTPTQKKLDKSLLSSVSEVTAKHTPEQLISNSNSTNDQGVDTATIIKSKSTKRIFSNSSSRNNILVKSAQYASLAQLIVDFIDEMKQLQMNIMRKANNVNDMKKAFERKKVSLYQEALKVCNLSPQTHTSTIISTPVPSSLNLATVNKSEDADDQKKNVKALNESISVLRIAIEDIKANSKFITEQLRTEIGVLTDKKAKLRERLDSAEQTMADNLKSIKELHTSITIAKQSKPLLKYDVISQEGVVHDFDWYIAEITKEIQNEGFSHEGDMQKMQKLMKSTSKDIIDILKPYIKEEESEIDFECFDSKSNYEEDIITAAIENLKKYIKSIITALIANKKEKESLMQSVNEAKLKAETYKAALDQTVMKITQSDTGKAHITERDNFKRINNDLLNIQNDLLKKLEMKDIEAEKNQETICTLIQLNTTVKSNGSNLVDKYRYVLQLYSSEQDKVRQLKSDYLHLIQEFSCYIDSGKKIVLDLANLANNIPTVNEKEKTSESYLNEELSSEEMGRINENDLLNNDDLNVNMTKESKCSNKNQVIHFKKVQLMKSEVIELTNKVKKLEQKLADNATLIETIGTTIEKLLIESHLSQKTKELFIFIFRLMNYSEERITSILLEREKKPGHR